MKSLVEKSEEIVTPLAEPADLELIRRITGGMKYTGGNINRRKYHRLVALGWLRKPPSMSVMSFTR
jgi:hypothetical protein